MCRLSPRPGQGRQSQVLHLCQPPLTEPPAAKCNLIICICKDKGLDYDISFTENQQIQKRTGEPTQSLEIPNKRTDEKDRTAGETGLCIVSPRKRKNTFLNKTILGIRPYRKAWGGAGRGENPFITRVFAKKVASLATGCCYEVLEWHSEVKTSQS